MGSNKSVTAIFSQQRYSLTANVSPSAGGSVTGGGVYASGADGHFSRQRPIHPD